MEYSKWQAILNEQNEKLKTYANDFLPKTQNQLAVLKNSEISTKKITCQKPLKLAFNEYLFNQREIKEDDWIQIQFKKKPNQQTANKKKPPLEEDRNSPK